jgi:hypothetical protein
MSEDGKSLENLVRQIEELLLPSGFSVKGNSRIYNDEGVQIAEFDVEIRGRLGSTDISWLIECRDRPGNGPAPGSWIEQLVGRRARFGFNKVTAVSTTGFAGGAEEYARQSGIELRSVKEVTAEDVADWLRLQHMTLCTRLTRLDAICFYISESESGERVEALTRKLEGITGNDKILRSTETGELKSPKVAFRSAVSTHPSLFDDITPNGPGKPVRIRVSYTDDNSHFVVDTDCGAVRVTEIIFQGEISIKQVEVPFASLKEYRRDGSGQRIAQIAAFPIEIQEESFSLELHHLADSGETHVLLRKISS